MSLTLAQRSNFWPLTAWGYPWWRARSLTRLTGQPFSLAREERLFLTLAQPQAGEHWLDLGTSTGFYAGVLSRQGCRVDALDLSPAMLRAAARREPSGLIRWQQGNAEETGLPAAKYAGVTIGATLNETAHPARLLRGAGRALSPGGRLWLMQVGQRGGAGQRVLSRVAGLTFPDLEWTMRQLPAFTLRHHLQLGAVDFILLDKLNKLDKP